MRQVFVVGTPINSYYDTIEDALSEAQFRAEEKGQPFCVYELLKSVSVVKESVSVIVEDGYGEDF